MGYHRYFCAHSFLTPHAALHFVKLFQEPGARKRSCKLFFTPGYSWDEWKLFLVAFCMLTGADENKKSRLENELDWNLWEP